MEVDLHGFHPSQIVKSGWLHKLVQRPWEIGEERLTLIPPTQIRTGAFTHMALTKDE